MGKQVWLQTMQTSTHCCTCNLVSQQTEIKATCLTLFLVYGKYNEKQSPIGAILTSILNYLLNCDQGCKFHYTLEF